MCQNLRAWKSGSSWSWRTHFPPKDFFSTIKSVPLRDPGLNWRECRAGVEDVFRNKKCFFRVLGRSDSEAQRRKTQSVPPPPQRKWIESANLIKIIRIPSGLSGILFRFLFVGVRSTWAAFEFIALPFSSSSSSSAVTNPNLIILFYSV